MDEKGLEKLKILTIGCSETGKTSIITRYTQGKFTNTHGNSIGVDYSQKAINLKPGRKINLQIWDTAG